MSPLRSTALSAAWAAPWRKRYASPRRCPVVRVGVEDEYGKSGPAAELLEVFGLCAANLAARVRDAMEIKRK